MSLCTSCLGINVNSIVPYCDPNTGDIHASYPLKPTFNALVDSALDCPLCHIFLQALELKNQNKDVPQAFKNHVRNNIWIMGGGQMFYDLNMPKGLSQIRINVGPGGTMEAADVSLVAYDNDPLALSGDVIGRMLETRTDSHHSFHQIREWFRACKDCHMECGVSASSRKEMDQPLPTRVIDISLADGSQLLRLLETNGIHGQYAALSYCWGSSPAFTTRRETYEARCKGFSYAELPKTLQDAVVVTRQIGLRYLWVDAVCIIQGDAADWETESGKMAAVYGNAAVTISATASRDTSSGCFVQRWLARTEPVAIQSPCSGSDKVGTMFISLKFGSIDESLDRSPLNSRGWCLQERVLSRRIIHFAEDQMYWECQKHCIAEGGTVIEEPNGLKRCLRFSNGGTSRPWETIIRSWHDIVTEYSRRNLSHLTDKIPALSGLADLVHRETGAQYLAGLWMEDLPFGLLWAPFLDAGETTQRAATWRAPSWSWASVNGRLDSQGYRAGATILSHVHDVAVVLEHRVVLAGKNRFGEVTEGILNIRARKRTAKYGKQLQYDYGGWTGNLSNEFPLLDDCGGTIGSCVFDVTHDYPPRDLDCLLICTGQTSNGVVLSYFLLIQPYSRQDYFTRIGAGTVNGKKFFERSNFIDVFLI